jgi:hypothetical protein
LVFIDAGSLNDFKAEIEFFILIKSVFSFLIQIKYFT